MDYASLMFGAFLFVCALYFMFTLYKRIYGEEGSVARPSHERRAPGRVDYSLI